DLSHKWHRSVDANPPTVALWIDAGDHPADHVARAARRIFAVKRNRAWADRSQGFSDDVGGNRQLCTPIEVQPVAGDDSSKQVQPSHASCPNGSRPCRDLR